MSFDSQRQNSTTAWTSGSTTSTTMSDVPVRGNLVVAVIQAAFSISVTSVKDGNNNSLAITPNSPSAVNDSTAGSCWLYWYVAPANAHQTFTVTFSPNPTVGMISVVEFSVIGGGTPALYVDIAGSGIIGTNINTPTITPAGPGGLLFAAACDASQITSVNSPWTGLANLPGLQGGEEWILSSGVTGSPVSVDMTSSASTKWDSMAAAFTQAAPLNVAGDDSQQITVIQQADNVVSIW